MDIYAQILAMDDISLKRFATERCSLLNTDEDDYYLGYNLPQNPVNLDFTFKKFVPFNYEIVYCHSGFIPQGTKVVYRYCIDPKSYVSFNDGGYYFIDDEKYIYDFLKYIKNFDIKDDYDILLSIFNFIHANFDSFYSHRKRDDVQKVIYKNENYSYERCTSSIETLMLNKAFECTEYSLVIQNLLSFFDIDSIYVIDKNHAYNICSFKILENDLNDSFYVVDSSCPVYLTDFSFENTKMLPFVSKINNPFDIKNVLDGKSVFKLDNYFYMEIGNYLYKMYDGSERIYGVNIVCDNPLVIKNNEKKLILK